MGLKRNMDEAGLEQSIINHLKDKAGYEYVSPEEMKLVYNTKYAFDEERLLRFLSVSQPKTYGELRHDDEASKDQFFSVYQMKLLARVLFMFLKTVSKIIELQIPL